MTLSRSDWQGCSDEIDGLKESGAREDPLRYDRNAEHGADRTPRWLFLVVLHSGMIEPHSLIHGGCSVVVSLVTCWLLVASRHVKQKHAARCAMGFQHHIKSF